ncbi:DUF4079 domain-containing protein [Tanacetum coccineum]
MVSNANRWHEILRAFGCSICPGTMYRKASDVIIDALAAGGEFGIFEGRSLAIWRWTIHNEINELKKQEKPAAVTPEGTPAPAPPSSLQTKIQQLSEVYSINVE